MTHAYKDIYLADAETCLANAFDYAINDCAVTGNIFAHAFIRSGLARQFERGNPCVVAGMSGFDVACEVLAYCGLLNEEPEPTYGRGLSPEYWTGQMLAHYQWSEGVALSMCFRAYRSIALQDSITLSTRQIPTSLWSSSTGF